MGIAIDIEQLWDEITLDDHLSLIGILSGLNSYQIEQNTEFLLSLFNIRRYKDQIIKDLSPSIRAKICLAILLLTKGRLYIVGSVLDHIDSYTSKQFLRILNETVKFNSGGTIITTSDPEILSGFGDQSTNIGFII